MTLTVDALVDYANAQFSWMLVSPEVGANTFSMNMPDLPDFAVAFYQYGGKEPDETFGNPNTQENPRAQVIVRDKKTSVAMNHAYEIWRLLNAIKEQDIGGVHFNRVKSVSSPEEIGPDAANRQRVTCNFQISIRGS